MGRCYGCWVESQHPFNCAGLVVAETIQPIYCSTKQNQPHGPYTADLDTTGAQGRLDDHTSATKADDCFGPSDDETSCRYQTLKVKNSGRQLAIFEKGHSFSGCCQGTLSITKQ